MPHANAAAHIPDLSTVTEIARLCGVDGQVPGYFIRRLRLEPARVVGIARMYNGSQVAMICDAIRARSRAAQGVASA